MFQIKLLMLILCYSHLENYESQLTSV